MRAQRGPRPGPKPKWGERSYVSIGWPADHRREYERLAAASGMSFTEYVIRFMAAGHGLIPEGELEGDEQLPLGA